MGIAECGEIKLAQTVIVVIIAERKNQNQLY
jgi:hypothetical protein